MRAPELPGIRPGTRPRRPVVVGHRGAAGYRPEHTQSSYELAIDLGAELIEPDIVVSGDGVLIARHESELSRSTDVATRPEFAGRRTTRLAHGRVRTGWFADDFTLAELRTLRAVERMPDLRPLNTAYDGREGILTFAEVVAIARRRSTASRPVRVLAELKPPGPPSAVHRVAALVAAELRRLDATGPDGPVVLQSFDAALLRALRADLGDDGPRMLQLVDDDPADDPLATPSGLRAISTYAQGIAPSRHRILLRGPDGALTGLSDLVHRSHEASLLVLPWTLRAENAFLPAHLRHGEQPGALGDAAAEARLLLALGVDGLITDFPDVAVAVRAEFEVADTAGVR